MKKITNKNTENKQNECNCEMFETTNHQEVSMFSRHDKPLLPIHPHDTVKLQVSSLTNLIKRLSQGNLVVKWTAAADVAFTAPKSRKHFHDSSGIIDSSVS